MAATTGSSLHMHYSITLWACLSQVHRTHTLHMQLPQAVDEVLTNSRKIHTRATLLSSGTNHKNLEHVVKNRERMRRIYNMSLQPGRPWPYGGRTYTPADHRRMRLQGNVYRSSITDVKRRYMKHCNVNKMADSSGLGPGKFIMLLTL